MSRKRGWGDAAHIIVGLSHMEPESRHVWTQNEHRLLADRGFEDVEAPEFAAVSLQQSNIPILSNCKYSVSEAGKPRIAGNETDIMNTEQKLSENILYLIK